MAEDGEHRPQRGDKVWQEYRHTKGMQPNGFIEFIVEWGSDGSVMVKYHDSDDREEISTAELDGKYHGQQLGYMLFSDGRYVIRKN